MVPTPTSPLVMNTPDRKKRAVGVLKHEAVSMEVGKMHEMTGKLLTDDGGEELRRRTASCHEGGSCNILTHLKMLKGGREGFPPLSSITGLQLG